MTQDFFATIDNLRVQRLMGINQRDGKVTAESVPSVQNRSAFSCERYQFFLDAPFEIGQQCCRYLKKNPLHKYQRVHGKNPIMAMMASESRLRSQQWIRSGCNAFDSDEPKSTPMAFWLEQDVLAYIYTHKEEMLQWRREECSRAISPEAAEKIASPLASVYGDVVFDYEAMGQIEGQMNFFDVEPDFNAGIFDFERPILKTTGCSRTGCFACGFGMHREKLEDNRLQKIIDYSNPKIADWILRGGHFRESDGLWEPHQGCGMWFVIEWCNRHGGLNIWYPNREYYLQKYNTKETQKYLN